MSLSFLNRLLGRDLLAVQAALARGADHRNEEGETAFEIAYGLGSDESAELIRKQEAQAREKTSR